jgi:hypothetical protein
MTNEQKAYKLIDYDEMPFFNETPLGMLYQRNTSEIYLSDLNRLLPLAKRALRAFDDILLSNTGIIGFIAYSNLKDEIESLTDDGHGRYYKLFDALHEAIIIIK